LGSWGIGRQGYLSVLTTLELMRVPDVELLWWEGCPSTETALRELRQALATAGLDAAEVQLREIRTDAEAGEAEFVGSPTILVDGEDVAPPGGEPVGLTCRVYHRRDGRVSPTPDPDDLLAALRRAAGQEVQ
jgi:hypothetical protein